MRRKLGWNGFLLGTLILVATAIGCGGGGGGAGGAGGSGAALRRCTRRAQTR